MRKKGLRFKMDRARSAKRPREEEIFEETDENQNAKKKNKSETFDNQINLFEEKFKEAIKTGIDLFHNRISSSAISFKERLAYMSIMKKAMTSVEWKFKRLISNKQQMECLTRKAIESPKERKDMLMIMEKFVEYKLKSFPGKTIHFKAESIAKHYQSELKCYGVTQGILASKIGELVNTIEQTEGSLPKIEKSPKQIIKTLKFKKNLCRLCGSKENLIYSINQKKDDIHFKDVVEYFCRVKIQDNDNLPHLVCKGCRDYIENFSKFSKRIETFQNKLNLDADNFIVPQEAIKTEVVDLDYEDTNSHSRDANDFNETSQDYTEYTIVENVTTNYAYNDDHVEMINSSHSFTEIEHDVARTESEIAYTETNLSDNIIQSNEDQNYDDNEINDEISYTQIPTSIISPPRKSSTASNSTLQECRIHLERLPIKYVPSDGEESSDELLEEVVDKRRKSRLNRPRSSLEINFQTIQSSMPDLTNLVS